MRQILVEIQVIDTQGRQAGAHIGAQGLQQAAPGFGSIIGRQGLQSGRKTDAQIDSDAQAGLQIVEYMELYSLGYRGISAAW